MKVTLIDYTGAAHENPSRMAAAILLFTKATRLNMDIEQLDKFFEMPEGTMDFELRKMAKTIPSSWEFVNYTFLFQEVTRAFTHQLVRTRNASYAQQTMRTVDVSGFDYMTPETLPPHCVKRYEDQMEEIAESYANMLSAGARVEDARGVLPTNIHTNIVMHLNLRTLAELTIKRSSPRVQGEYREALEKMVECVCEVHRWAPIFLNRDNNMVIDELDEYLKDLSLSNAERLEIWKKIDQIRRQD